MLAGPREEGQPQEEFCCNAAQAPHIDGHGVWVAQHHLRWRQGQVAEGWEMLVVWGMQHQEQQCNASTRLLALRQL